MRKILVFLVFGILILYLIISYCFSHENYQEKLYHKINKIVELKDAPRGKIYDVNGRVLVDNKQVNNIVFYNLKDINLSETIKKVSDIFEFESPTLEEKIGYYKFINNEDDLLTSKEKDKIKRRTINKDKLLNKKIKNKVKKFSEVELKNAKIYAILTDGYIYEPKIIKSNVSSEEIEKVLQKDIPGVKIESSFERYYPYENSLKTILGSIGSVRKEHLKKGFKMHDIVGISGIEKYYDNYLRGTKAKYLLNNDNSLTLLEKEKKGSDLYLSIDIEMQIKIDAIIKDNIKRAKYYPNTNYLTDSYVIMSNPKTGEIKAISGWRLLDNNEFNDIAINNISSSFTMGSVVKGSTISVGYQMGLIDPEKLIYDGCIKLKNLTQKCSWKELGYLNSVTALEQSSNYYQFLIAIKLAGQEYYPDMQLNVSKKEFDIYRKMLSSYGLGVKSNIDLPNEKTGIKGKTISPDLLLNLSIGQYDTYTPIELLTYINTIGDDGKKRKPTLVQKIISDKKIIYENKMEVVEKVKIEKDDMKRIQEGFYYVMNRGTGLGFMNQNVNPAGKTGTSESFYDYNNDGKVDTSTLSLTLAGYYPYDNPDTSLIIVSPHASFKSGHDFIYYITASIAREITSIENTTSS